MREWLGLSPVYVKLAGKHGEVAFMALTDQELEAYFAKHPDVKLVRGIFIGMGLCAFCCASVF